MTVVWDEAQNDQVLRSPDGTLTLMIGGEADDIERCRAVLESLGSI